MMEPERELLLRSLDGELTPEEANNLEAKLTASAALRAERERLVRLKAMLSAGAASSFDPGFSDRILGRIWKDREASRAASDSLYGSLRWVFVRVAPACLLLAVGLGVYSGLVVEGGLSSSLLESILGLPAESFDSALYLNSM